MLAMGRQPTKMLVFNSAPSLVCGFVVSPPSPTSARLTSTGKPGISNATKRLQLDGKRA
jgi:hypothetical protein